MMRDTIMTEKLARRGLRIPTDYEPDFLNTLSVADVMEKNPLTAGPHETVVELTTRLATPGSPWHDVRLVPITSPDNVLLGVIGRADLFAALEASPDIVLPDAGVDSPVTIHPNAALSDAVDLMILNGIGRLPVVDNSAEPKLLGLLTRRAIFDAKRIQLESNQIRTKKQIE